MNENIINAVKVIKAAILESQAQVLRNANCSLLSLYYGIGRFVSANSRKRTWGTGAIAAISELLQKEMPGLRGFGERNIKNMRTFYEFWSPLIDRQGIDVFNIEEIKDIFVSERPDCGHRLSWRGDRRGKIVGESAFMVEIIRLEMLSQFVFVPSTAPRGVDVVEACLECLGLCHYFDMMGKTDRQKRLKVESGSRRLPNCIQRHQRGGI